MAISTIAKLLFLASSRVVRHCHRAVVYDLRRSLAGACTVRMCDEFHAARCSSLLYLLSHADATLMSNFYGH